MARRKPKRRMDESEISIIGGIAWYDRDEWAKLKRIVADMDKLDDTYEDWLHHSERLEREIGRPGMIIRRVMVNVDSLVAWCSARQKSVDGAARAEFVQ